MLKSFCRDLKTYLTQATSRPAMFVKIKTRYLAGDDTGRRIAYGMYLAQLFFEYRYRRDTYILPYEVALATLNNFREVCNKLRSANSNSTTISFHVPRAMRNLLDELSRRWGLSISELVRYAIERMINKFHGEPVEVALTPQARQALEELVRRGVYKSVEDAILDAITQLIQRYKSA